MAKINSNQANNLGVMLSETTDPAGGADDRPATDQRQLYTKTDGLYLMDDAGTVTQVLGDGGTTLQLTFAASTELTIAAGAVTAIQSSHTIDTQSDAASDDLDTISGGTAGDMLVIRAAHTGRTVVVKHSTGNIECPGNADIDLDDTETALILFFDGTNWLVANRGDAVKATTLVVSGDIDHDGSNIGFFGGTPGSQDAMAAWTGTATRTTVATGSATTQNNAEAIMAIIETLRKYGMFS